jgi:hypothetical protein
MITRIYILILALCTTVNFAMENNKQKENSIEFKQMYENYCQAYNQQKISLNHSFLSKQLPPIDTPDIRCMMIAVINNQKITPKKSTN